MDYFWPPMLCPATSDIEVQDNSGRMQSPLSGYIRTNQRPGSRIRMTLQFRNLTALNRKMMQSLFASLRAADRVWTPDHSYVQRGSFDSEELVANPVFEDGLDGYTFSSVFSSSVADQRARLTRTINTGIANSGMRLTNAITGLDLYRPYVFRTLVVPGRGPSDELRLNIGSTAFGSEYSSLTDLEAGLMTRAFVTQSTFAHFSLGQGIGAGIVGDYFTVPFFSVSACALVDNGANHLPWSSDINNAEWNQGGGIGTSSTTVVLPDGTTGTVNTIKEDASASASHFIGDNVTVTTLEDTWEASAAFKSANRSWVQVRLQDVTAGSNARVNVNLATGAIGTVSGAAPWTDIRGFVTPLGDGWYKVTVIARNTGSNTNLGFRAFIGSADETTTINGQNQDSVRIWLPTLSRSSVPSRLISTAGTAFLQGSNQNLLGGLHTKGWPVSTDGLLLPGDQVQIASQLVIVTAPVNSNADGTAFLQHAPSLRRYATNEGPVVCNMPMAKMMPDEGEVGWNNQPAYLSGASIVLGEAP
jgi:hypothetical protein